MYYVQQPVLALYCKFQGKWPRLTDLHLAVLTASLVLEGPYFEIRHYFENCDWINQWLKLLVEAQSIRLQSSRPSCFTARCAGFDKIVISVCVVLVDLVLQPSREDLDMNQHVSNLKYISWVFEVHGKMFLLIKAFAYI
jgi:hypothetical protein